VIGEQQSPRLTVIHRDTNVPLVENDAITFVGCLDTAILEAVEDDQDDGFRLMADKLSPLVQQLFQDRLSFQVVQFDLVEFLHIGTERLTCSFSGRRARVSSPPYCGLLFCFFPDGNRDLVDRADRRDLSIFQIGLRTIERNLTNALSILIRLIPVYGYKL
jgi:hypothetical protein